MAPVTHIDRQINQAIGVTTAIQGWFHEASDARGVVVLTHGAGTNCQTALLVAVADTLAEAGYSVLRYDLPFRQARPSGPPVSGNKGQALDRDGIRAVAIFLRARTPNLPLYLAGHSYGGRQSSMAASEDSALADGLLLLSYPLHPPRQPEKLRTEHFPALHVPAMFVHGTKDEFGSPDEMRKAIAQIPARTDLLLLDRAGHGLAATAAESIVESFSRFFGATHHRSTREDQL